MKEQTPYQAYGAIHKRSLKGRALEGEAFMQAATLLRQAQDDIQNTKRLSEALNYTRRLWMIVEADLNSPQNKLDKTLKAKLLSLSLFVERQCLEITKKPHPQALMGLIEINHNVAQGLLST